MRHLLPQQAVKKWLDVSEMQQTILLINAIFLGSRDVLLEIVVEQSYKSTLGLKEQGRDVLKRFAEI